MRWLWRRMSMMMVRIHDQSYWCLSMVYKKHTRETDKKHKQRQDRDWHREKVSRLTKTRKSCDLLKQWNSSDTRKREAATSWWWRRRRSRDRNGSQETLSSLIEFWGRKWCRDENERQRCSRIEQQLDPQLPSDFCSDWTSKVLPNFFPRAVKWRERERMRETNWDEHANSCEEGMKTFAVCSGISRVFPRVFSWRILLVFLFIVLLFLALEFHFSRRWFHRDSRLL